jgi:ABC-type antimicrobial peptide transport system permease subunit
MEHRRRIVIRRETLDNANDFVPLTFALRARVLSFIVARRTREIGIRVALGASRQRVVGAIFRRPLIQVGLGILAGAALIAAAGSIETDMPGLSGGLSLKDVAMLLAYATLMLGVCLLACVVPTRRALSVEPTIALLMD